MNVTNNGSSSSNKFAGQFVHFLSKGFSSSSDDCEFEETRIGRRQSVGQEHSNTMRRSSMIPPDDPKHITWGRRIARSLQRYSWYYKPNSAATSLEEGWSYFEHVTLPRYVLTSAHTNTAHLAADKKAKVQKYVCGSATHSQLTRAEPGDVTQRTRLYPVWHTPLSQMGDFGIGVGLYFTTLRALGVICLLAGLVSLPNILYYKSTHYSVIGQPPSQVKYLTIGSAICTDQPWVPCSDCTEEQFKNEARYRFATTCPPNNNIETTNCTVFVKKNNCLGAELQQGITNLVTLALIFIAMLFFNWYVRAKAIDFDEDEQTAQDYSILISNPPSDAYEPDEWKRFFHENFDVQVTVCTVVVANDLLLQVLHDLRDKQRQLDTLLLCMHQTHTISEHTDIAKLAADALANSTAVGRLVRSILRQTLGFGWDLPSLYEQALILTHRARGLAQVQHKVSKVFVTFETEEDQRLILNNFSYGKLTVWKHQKRQTSGTVVVPTDCLFRGTHALIVTEPAEPSAIRWDNLDDTLESQMISLSITTFVCICAVVLIAFIVSLCRQISPIFAAIVISVFNVIFPIFANLMTNMESHTDEGHKQRSLYIKIALFRWVNTAIVILVITPFTTIISYGKTGLINQIYAVFLADIFTANVLQYVNIGGQFQRHFSAPRAPDQERMNMCFRGTPYDLAERYTSLTKILFFAFFYSAIYPATYFFAAAAFFVNYFVDKFSILRSWAAAPKLGTQVSEFSRKFFLNGCIIALAVMTSYLLSGFPFDNLCALEDSVTVDATYEIYPYVPPQESQEPVIVTVNAGDAAYKYCNQNLLSMRVFPALPGFQPVNSQWMTVGQEHVTNIYGWTSFGVVAFFFLVLAWRIGKLAFAVIHGGYKSHGRDMNINFSDVDVIDSYVPQVKSEQYAYPLIACNIDNICESLMSWKDPSKPYDYYNLTKDVAGIFEGTNFTAHDNAFSKIAHWPPDDDE